MDFSTQLHRRRNPGRVLVCLYTNRVECNQTRLGLLIMAARGSSYAPTRSGRVQSSPFEYSTIQSSPFEYNPVQSIRAQSSPVHSSTVQSSPFESSPVHSNTVQFIRVQSHESWRNKTVHISFLTGFCESGLAIAIVCWKMNLEKFICLFRDHQAMYDASHCDHQKTDYKASSRYVANYSTFQSLMFTWCRTSFFSSDATLCAKQAC